jgi:hypothetical protein
MGQSPRFAALDPAVPEWVHDDLVEWLDEALDAIVEHIVNVFEMTERTSVA